MKEVLDKATILVKEQNVKNKGINNLVKGFCIDGRTGEEFFKTNRKLVDLEKVFLNDTAKKDIISLINENLDPEGRNYENIVTMMLEDGIFNVLPKKDDGWTEFYKPFIRLTKKEIKSYERKT